ncbi:type II toxin-antitoxin system RelE/ParE family toxin [Flavobacterium sp. FlaQc-47]|jgi:plasmid stabilization system protein ParE|uniref:type II toxin-antitoxin system RelE/ParE family toxin n=1 Tax=Flavobacterium sp. FlaQc-47 TaxID=3374180 RepID=UPI00375761A2
MNNSKPVVFWTQNAKEDLKEIFLSLKKVISKEKAIKIRDELFNCTDTIVFAEQFQVDEYRFDCRRIIIRKYKVLYQFKENSIFVIRVFNSFQNPIKSLK